MVNRKHGKDGRYRYCCPRIRGGQPFQRIGSEHRLRQSPHTRWSTPDGEQPGKGTTEQSPHTRWSTPDGYGTSILEALQSPLTRRSTDPALQEKVIGVAIPAYAVVNPGPFLSRAKLVSSPPPTRWSTHHHFNLLSMLEAIPAYAVVNRSEGPGFTSPSSSPRIRGGQPSPWRLHARRCWQPPHTRWSTLQHAQRGQNPPAAPHTRWSTDSICRVVSTQVALPACAAVSPATRHQTPGFIIPAHAEASRKTSTRAGLQHSTPRCPSIHPRHQPKRLTPQPPAQIPTSLATNTGSPPSSSPTFTWAPQSRPLSRP